MSPQTWFLETLRGSRAFQSEEGRASLAGKVSVALGEHSVFGYLDSEGQ